MIKMAMGGCLFSLLVSTGVYAACDKTAEIAKCYQTPYDCQRHAEDGNKLALCAKMYKATQETCLNKVCK